MQYSSYFLFREGKGSEKKWDFPLKYGPHPTTLNGKNDGGIWQSGISKSLAGYVQHRVCFVNVESSLHENVVFSVCACVGNAAYIIFIIWNSISGLDAWYHFQFYTSCGVIVMGRSHKKKNQVTFYGEGRGAKNLEGRANF